MIHYAVCFITRLKGMGYKHVFLMEKFDKEGKSISSWRSITGKESQEEQEEVDEYIK